MARKRKFTVVKTSPFGRPQDVVSLDPDNPRVARYVEVGLLLEGNEPDEVEEPPAPPADVAGEPEPEAKPKPRKRTATKADTKDD